MNMVHHFKLTGDMHKLNILLQYSLGVYVYQLLIYDITVYCLLKILFFKICFQHFSTRNTPQFRNNVYFIMIVNNAK